MKMTKLLAIGSAAAVAVASLASVASAKEQTFDMGITKGNIKFNATAGKEVDFLANAAGLAPAELGISADDVLAINVSNATKKVTGINLKVTGIKGSKASSSKTYTYAFGNYASDSVFDWTTQKYDGSGSTWALQAYASVAPADSFVPSQFVEITQISIEIACESTVTTATAYDAYGSTTWGENIDGLKVIPFQNAQWTDILMAINNSLNAWGTDTVDSTGIYAAYSEKSTSVDYPFIAKKVSGDNNTLERADIQLLSKADSNEATTNGGGKDGNQTYDDNHMGTNPNEFAGLASQVADFFNKQTNGTITFKFTTAAASSGTTWSTGGIPSTQVGIKNLVGDSTANDFALFFNYDQTGSLQAVTELDKDAGEVIFDISDVLDALGGQTMGVIDNIWFGLAKGVYYEDLKATGLKVETVTLAYDEEDDADIEDEDDTDDVDDEDDDIDDVDDEDDDDDDYDDDDDDEDDVTVDDDDDDTDDADDEDDSSDVAGDNNTVVVKPAGDDSNPNTGVALAVVPAAIAAAAVVVSKKRK